MKGAFGEFGLLLLAAIAVVTAVIPSVRSNRKSILVATVLLTIGLTATQYYLIAYTGRGLFERAACVAFSKGPACQVASLAPSEPLVTTGDWDQLAVAPPDVGVGWDENECNGDTCLEVLRRQRAHPDVISFYADNHCLLRKFYEFGMIDAGECETSAMNEPVEFVFLNGAQKFMWIVRAESGWKQQMQSDADFAKLNSSHQNSLEPWKIWSIGPSYRREDGGQWIRVHWDLRAGCRGCERPALAEVQYGFSSDGTPDGARFRRLHPLPEPGTPSNN